MAQGDKQPIKRRKPGEVRDAILDIMKDRKVWSVGDVHAAVEQRLGPTARSSVRSYFTVGLERHFVNEGRGKYRRTR